MGLSSRTSRFFGNPSPGKTFGDVARQLNFIIKENTKRTSDVVLAAYSIGCDGAPTVTLLDGSPCDTGQDRIGLATRDRALLTGTLPQPLRSNNAGTGSAVATVAVDGGAAAGRFFVDTAKALYEGRNGLYHAGRYPTTATNGATLGDVAAYDEVDWFSADDARVAFGSHVDDEFSQQHEIKTWSDGWSPTGTYLPSAEVFGPDSASYGSPYYSPDFCVYSTPTTLEPFGALAGETFVYAVTSAAYASATIPYPDFLTFVGGGEKFIDGGIFLGRCATSGGGRRISNTYRVSIEAYSETDVPFEYPDGGGAGWGSLTPEEQALYLPQIISAARFKVCLVFRDATTYEVLGRKHLSEVEDYARSKHPTRCQVEDYGTYPWRAGIVVRPAADGTCVVSILDSERAWVFDHVETDPESGAIEPRLLETVTFPSAYSGVIRVLYR